MVKTYSWNDLIIKWPELEKKTVLFDSVLGNPDSIYYLPPNTLVSVNGLRGNQPLYLVTNLVCEYGIIHIKPSQVPIDKKYIKNNLIVTEEELIEVIPDIDKVTPTKMGYMRAIDRMKQVTQSGQYFFHSGQGLNFIVTCAGFSLQGFSLYRVYQLIVENNKPLRLSTPRQP